MKITPLIRRRTRIGRRATCKSGLIGESENKYQYEAKGIFNGRRHCIKTRWRVLSFVSKLFSDPPICQNLTDDDLHSYVQQLTSLNLGIL